MEIVAIPEIIAAERLNGGLVIKFNDGKCAFFSTFLLYATLPEAEDLDETLTEW